MKGIPLDNRGSAVLLVRTGSFFALGGVAVFAATVILLQHLQAGYDPVTQLMSELALGEHGIWMIGAFAALGLAVAGFGIGLTALGAGVLGIVPLLAGMAFVSAGVFPLGGRPDIHIAIVATAFVLSALLMIIGPLRVPGHGNPLRARRRLSVALVSWVIAFLMIVFVLLGNELLPAGVAQRAATSCLLLWLVLGGVWMLRLARQTRMWF